MAFDWRDFIKGVVSLEGDFAKGVASLEGDNLVVFYYLSVSEIWPDKKGGLS